MARNEVVDKDNGWDRIQKQTVEIKGYGVKVGVLGDKNRDDGGDMVMIALVNEFGAEINHPGGTPYKIVEGGHAVFTSKGDPEATGVTQPHTINIPSRSFIRGAYGEHRKEIGETKDRLARLVLAGKLDVDRAMKVLGQEHVEQIREYMTALDQPPNAPSTVARKRGSTNPLIDTGQLRRSIDWERD